MSDVELFEELLSIRESKTRSLRQLQYERQVWDAYNFDSSPPHHPLLGAMEELGELTHAHLKLEAGIRGTEAELEAKAKDAIGDLFVYLTGYCSARNWDIAKVVFETWDEVKQRDWKKYPLNGKTE